MRGDHHENLSTRKNGGNLRQNSERRKSVGAGKSTQRSVSSPGNSRYRRRRSYLLDPGPLDEADLIPAEHTQTVLYHC